MKRQPNLFISFLPLIFLIFLLSANVYYFGDSVLDGANQIALLLSAFFAGILATLFGRGKFIMTKIKENVSVALLPIIILLLIGALSGAWLVSGIIPAMIYYGLEIMNPRIFLVTSCAACAVISLVTGSSWSTIATLGIALLGMGKAMGIPEGMVAGSVISGAYFGDKMSPLSDTTTLAPAVAGTDLFTHIRYMAKSTVPTIFIVLVIYFILGLTMPLSPVETSQIETVQQLLKSHFSLNLMLFMVPFLVVFLIIKKLSAIASLGAGILAAILFAIIFQKDLLNELKGDMSMYNVILRSIYGDTSIPFSNSVLSSLLNSGGMAGMLHTVWLILSAMIFGGVMEAAGFLERIVKTIAGSAKSALGLVSRTGLSCIFFNLTASDQYLSIVVPGRMFAKKYEEAGKKPELLSRTLEDTGTVTSVLVPWNTCGAAQAAVLGVATVSYLPYAFFPLLMPFATLIAARMIDIGSSKQTAI